ncbi:phage holin family protein [Serratia quinivorans]|uniref:phage holin family protein n=1 Tax=Serratia quinivorans TaxID=137545 RepID=UPI001C4882AE|nr:phage holin family protein [Serratia quinivorans]MBV6694017.1 phage holin family protein [Serratia quinivorans]
MLYSLNEESITLSLIAISIIGGTVNYCLDCAANKLEGRGMKFFFGQVLVAGFTGFLGGLLCIENTISPIMTLFVSGVSGTIGSVLLKEIQQRMLKLVRNK